LSNLTVVADGGSANGSMDTTALQGGGAATAIECQVSVVLTEPDERIG